MELEFEALKYKSFVNSNPRFNSHEKELMERLITDYFNAKKDLKFSENINFDFSLKDSQKLEIDRLMLNPNISYEVKQICKDMLIQTFTFQNSTQGL